MLCNTTLERGVGLLLQNTEAGEVRWWPILFVKGGKIKPFMTRERFIRDNLNFDLDKAKRPGVTMHTLAVKKRCCSSRSRFFNSF